MTNPIDYQEKSDLKLTDGIHDYYLLPDGMTGPMGSVTFSLSTEQEAERFVRDSVRSTGNSHGLQAFLTKKHYGSVWSLSDTDLSKTVAGYIVGCKFISVDRPPMEFVSGSYAGSLPVAEKIGRFSISFRLPCFGSSFIACQIVDDPTGDSIPGVLNKIHMSDEYFKELVSAYDGRIRVDHVKRGESGFEFNVSSIYMANLENTFGYVELGPLPSENGKDPANKAKRIHKLKKPETRNHYYYIADIQEYQVQAGETFTSIAESFDMTFRELAFFNWGIYEREKILKYMAADVGAGNRTPDGRDYMFTGEEDPGIVFIPVPIDIREIDLNTEHIIRVKKCGYTVRYLYQFDDDIEEIKDDVITLISRDGTWEYSIDMKDIEITEEGWTELIFPVPPPDKVCSLIHSPGEEPEAFYIFKDLTADEIRFGRDEYVDVES